MVSEGLVRVGLAVVLLLGAVGLGVHYDIAAEDHDAARVGETRLADPDANVGESVYAWTELVAGPDDRPTVAVAGNRFAIVPTDTADANRLDAAAPGDPVQVAGTLVEPNVIDAHTIVISDKSDFPRMYVLSAVGGLFAMWLFLRRWRIDREHRTFVPRGESRD